MLCGYCLSDTEMSGAVVAKHRDGPDWCVMSDRPPWVWDEPATREAVASRSGGICEACCRCRATEMHHRKSRSLGGKWSPANIAHLCHSCHAKVTEPRDLEAARRSGLVIRSTDEPEAIPVRCGNTELVLSDAVLPPRIANRRRR